MQNSIKQIQLVIYGIVFSIYAKGQNISFTATPENGCSPLQVSFTNTSDNSAIHFSWDFGDGSEIDTTENPVHTFNGAREYYVALTAYDTDNYVIDNFSKTIIVNGANINNLYFSNDSICTGDSITFDYNDNTYEVLSFQWDLGNGILFSEYPPVYNQYNADGEYTIKLIIETGCGFDTISKKGFVSSNLPANANFEVSPTHACPGDLVNLDVLTSLNQTYYWDMGDGYSDSEPGHPSYVYESTGDFVITLVAMNSCGNIDTVFAFIKIDSTAIPEIPYFSVFPEPACPNQKVGFTPWGNNPWDNGTGAISYSWDFGDGAQSQEKQSSHKYAVTGKYSVTLTVTNMCGNTNSYSDTIVVDNTSIPQIYYGISIFPEQNCPGDEISFQAGDEIVWDPWDDDIVAYSWDFGDGTTSSEKHPKHAYNNYGTYIVTMAVTNLCGNISSVKDTIIIDNTSSPSFSAWLNSMICKSDTVIFFAEGYAGNYTYVWEFGDGTNSYDFSTFSYNTNRGYTRHAYQDTGYYSATITAVNGCGNSVSQSIDVIVSDENSFVDGGLIIDYYDTATYLLPCIEYQFLGYGGNSYEWNFGDGTTCTLSNPVHSFDTAGTYNITLKVTNGCGYSEMFIYPTNVIGECNNTGIYKLGDRQVFEVNQNPSDGNFLIKLALNKANLVEYGLYDIYGKKLFFAKEFMPEGENIIYIDQSNTSIASGLYVLRIVIDNSIASNQKIIITK